MKKLLLPLISLLMCHPLDASTIQVPQSGQTIVHAISDDGDIRAGKPWPNPRFRDNGNQTVTDNLTGLVWTRDANLIKSLNPGFDRDDLAGDAVVVWQHALNYIKKLNKERFLGFSDWRLPNINELASLEHQGEASTATWLNRSGFTNVQLGAYWSSSTSILDTGMAWVVYLDNGQVNNLDKSGRGNLWPVRGGKIASSGSSSSSLPKTGQNACYDSNGAKISCAGTGQDGELQRGAAWPNPRFTDNSDQTLTDRLTGLIWAGDANIMYSRTPPSDIDGSTFDGAVTWQDALDYVKKLNDAAYLGFSDWRLPNRNELASLMTYLGADASEWLVQQQIVNIRTHYWSSTTVAFDAGKSWDIATNGVILPKMKMADSSSYYGSFVWPVRGGGKADDEGRTDATADNVSAVRTAAAAVALTVSTTSMPVGVIGTAYSQTLAATGGTAPYTWSRSNGTLPAGLALSTAGVISGTPTAAKTSSFTVQVKDKANATATKSLSITVNAALTVSTASLAAGTVGSAYSQTLAATGGITPYTWSINSGTLPAGLAISSAGVITGTPTTAGSSTFTVQVADANSVKANKSLTIVINAVLTITTATLPDGYVATAYSQTLAATGGKSPYTWARTAGTLPAGLSLNASTGAITGTPTTAGSSTFTVQVKDANNATVTKSLSLTVYTALSVSTASLPAGVVGSTYSQTLAAAGGKTPFTWTVSSGTFPGGLTLAATGVIAGTPTVAGSSSVTFKVTDANNKTATKALTISVNSAPLTVTTAMLPDGVVGAFYSQTLSASGGKTPYTWSRTSGSLPSGITLSSAGVLSGTPTATGSRTFTVQVKDANNATATKSLTMNVNPPVSIGTSSLANGNVGFAYSQTLTAVGGTAPFNWSVTSGSLPVGLTLNAATGVISGMPSADGWSDFTVQVTDANNTTATGQLQIYIIPAVSVSTALLPDDYVGIAYNQTLAATGGTPPYSWTITGGALPAGLALASDTGAISGTPTAAGASNFTVQVTDANNAVAIRPMTIKVTGFASISGIVTDKDTGAPLPGVNVTLALTGITSKDPNDRIYTCNSNPLTATDYTTVAANDAVKYGCTSSGKYNTMSFKVRNPFGVDPFTSRWNGISGTNRVEYLAQSFKPTVSGNVTKVSVYLPFGKNSGGTGQLWVQLKSVLGGDAGTQLAESAIVSINSLPSGTAVWVDFVFPTPASVTAGQQYYFEIQGTVFLYNALDSISWGNDATYANGSGYQRNGGLWSKLSNSLSYQTYMDNQLDVSVGPAASNSSLAMAGGAYQEMNMYVHDNVSGWDLPGGTVDNTLKHLVHTTYGFEYNGDDLTIDWTVSTGLANYYDQNGWVTVAVDNYSTIWITPPITSLVTDQFSLTFNRTLTAVTDANGAYSFPSLPDGNYALTFVKAEYVTGTASGPLSPGQVLTHSPTLNGALNIKTATLPDGYSGSAYSQTLAAGGGKAPYSWAVITGSLPSGLTLNTATGAITGAPTGAGAGNFTVQLTDANNVTATKSLTITIYAAPAISTTACPDGYVTGVYSLTLTSTGGKAPYTWSVTSGNLPAGLTLNASTGVISGTPTTAGSSSFTVQSLDANNITATSALSITVYAAVSISTSLLPDVFIGSAYNQSLAAGGGKAPYTWSIITGSLPAGLTLDGGAGAITGTTTAAGTSTFTVQVTDANNMTAMAALSINVTIVQSLGDIGNVAIMVLAGNFDGKNPDGSINVNPRQAIAKAYFKTHGDPDFLVFLSTFDYVMTESEAQGFYLGVKNDTQGINQPIFDNSALFGSAGKLQGTIDLGNVTALTANPYGPKLDAAIAVLNHELMHRFGAYVRFKNPDGTLNMALLGKDNAHWSYLLDTQGSFMYGNGWKDNGDGTFTSTAKQSGYSPLDLYLMGMIPKEQVPPMLLIDNPAIDKTQLPLLGATVSGTAKTVTINDIIAAEGARVPDATTSQKKFNVGFVLLTRPGDNAISTSAAIETLRTAWAGRFAELTQGVGGVTNIPATLNVLIDSPSDGATITGPDVMVTGSVINSTGAETGVVVNGMPATVTGSRFIVNHMPLQADANTLTVTATDANGLTTTVTRGVTAQAGNYIRITSNIESGVAPLNISLRLDGSFSIANPTVTAFGPVPITLTAGASPAEFTTTLTVEGKYTFTASAVGPDGQMYSDTVTVTVLSQEKIDNLLRTRWEGMKMALNNKDVSGASAYFIETTRSKYASVFQQLAAHLTEIAIGMSAISLDFISQDFAEYRIVQAEQVNNQSRDLSYFIYFVKDRNGLWKIDSM